MEKKNGKIIAVIGAPRSGKSFLSKLLAKHYGGKVFLQGEEMDFPERIREDIEKNIRPLERILWFRNKLVKRYLLAEESKRKGEIIILDTFWMSYQLHIDSLAEGFRHEVISEVAEIDQKMMGYPDVIVFLSVTEETIRKFIKLGGRKFDSSEEFITDQALPVEKAHREFLEKNKDMASKVIVVQRDLMDFSKATDFQKIIDQIEAN